MYYEVQEVELNGEVFPYRIDNLILQEIQSKYTNITDFVYKMMGLKEKDGHLVKENDPPAKIVNEIFPSMVKEGFACKNKECPYSNAEIIRAIDKTPVEMAVLIKNELDRCLSGKKKEMSKAPKKRMPKSE